jgi:hypothetical protein
MEELLHHHEGMRLFMQEVELLRKENGEMRVEVDVLQREALVQAASRSSVMEEEFKRLNESVDRLTKENKHLNDENAEVHKKCVEQASFIERLTKADESLVKQVRQ